MIMNGSYFPCGRKGIIFTAIGDIAASNACAPADCVPSSDSWKFFRNILKQYYIFVTTNNVPLIFVGTRLV